MGWESEIIHLTYGDFLNAIDDYLDLNDEDRINVNKIAHKLEKQKDVIGTWKIKRYKTNMPFITFNSPESTDAIIDYLADKNKRNNQHKSGEDPLFYSLQNKKLSTTAFNAIFQRINDRIGFPIDKKTNRRYFTSHKLRKLFTTTLYNQGVDILAVDWMLGHRINPITEAYLKMTPSSSNLSI